MGVHDSRPCTCGSGQMSRWINDARGIPLHRACPKCEAEKAKKFRPEVLTDPNYEAEEPIEED
jgi:hypothetical protein